MLFYCWGIICDANPIVKPHCVNVSYLHGRDIFAVVTSRAVSVTKITPGDSRLSLSSRLTSLPS